MHLEANARVLLAKDQETLGIDLLEGRVDQLAQEPSPVSAAQRVPGVGLAAMQTGEGVATDGGAKDLGLLRRQEIIDV